MRRKLPNRQPYRPEREKQSPIPVIVAIIGATATIVAALIGIVPPIVEGKHNSETQTEESRLAGITATAQASVIIADTTTPSVTSSPTETLTPTNTLFPTDTSPLPTIASTLIPSLDLADQLVVLIDKYFSCLNSAVPNDGDDSDYEACWNMLSNRPGEYQSVTNKKNFFDNWKKYKISYALFFCSKNYNNSIQYLVHVRYYLYDRKDDSTPIENGTQYYAEYIFAHDDQGWRIKGANFKLDDIGSFCENDPRINRLNVSP
jgi:hypothetical protein